MWAAVRLAHNGDDSNTGGGADGLGDEFGQDVLFIVFGHSGDDGS